MKICLDIGFVYTDFVKATINHIGCTFKTDLKKKNKQNWKQTNKKPYAKHTHIGQSYANSQKQSYFLPGQDP